MMKKISYVLILLSILNFGCSDSNSSLFQVQNSVDFSVLAGKNTIETHYYVRYNVPTQWRNFFDISGFSENSVGDIVSNRATISGIFDVNLDFVNSVSIFAYPNDISAYNNDMLVGKEIFFMDFVQIGAKTSIELFGNITPINEIITEDEMIIEIRLEYRQFSPSTLDLRLNMDFSVFEN